MKALIISKGNLGVLAVQSFQSERKSDPTHETITVFLYNSMKTATHYLAISFLPNENMLKMYTDHALILLWPKY